MHTLLFGVCFLHPRYVVSGSAKFVYLVRYGKGAGSSWHCWTSLTWPRDLPASPWLRCGRQTNAGDCQSCVWGGSGALEFLSRPFYCTEVRIFTYLLLCPCCSRVFSPSSNSFRWKYIGNGKLGQFCVWMAVTPGVWVSWPPGRRGKHFHSAAKQTLLRRLLFSQTAICMYMLWDCYTTL